MREKEFRATLEESKRVERKAQDERRNIELALESVNTALSEARIHISGAEGRISALEAQLARVEGARKDDEFKLSSIVSSLRRTIGFRPSANIIKLQSRNNSGSPPRRNRSPPFKGFSGSCNRLASISPNRSMSPDRSLSPNRNGYDKNVNMNKIFEFVVW